MAGRPPLDEQALIEAEVANGWLLLKEAEPATLSSVECSKYALSPDDTYLQWEADESAEWQGVVAGGASWQSGLPVKYSLPRSIRRG